MANYYLSTYIPLVASKHGRVASKLYGIPPFVDGSIRREPDLECPFPSISCLCRAGKFAPRLRKGDVVGYMTCKGRYGESTGKRRRLTAVLRVLKELPTHEDAAAWYRRRGLKLPSNCMVPGNPPVPLGRSHRKHPGGGCGWDRRYKKRASQYPVFLVCEPLFRKLCRGAPTVTDAHILAAFHRKIGTQNPGALARERFLRLLEIVLAREDFLRLRRILGVWLARPGKSEGAGKG